MGRSADGNWDTKRFPKEILLTVAVSVAESGERRRFSSSGSGRGGGPTALSETGRMRSGEVQKADHERMSSQLAPDGKESPREGTEKNTGGLRRSVFSSRRGKVRGERVVVGDPSQNQIKGSFFFSCWTSVSLCLGSEICRRQSVRGKPVAGIHSETGAEWLH